MPNIRWAIWKYTPMGFTPLYLTPCLARYVVAPAWRGVRWDESLMGIFQHWIDVVYLYIYTNIYVQKVHIYTV